MNEYFYCKWNNFSSLFQYDRLRWNLSDRLIYQSVDSVYNFFLNYKGIPQNTSTLQMLCSALNLTVRNLAIGPGPLLRSSSESEGLFPVCLFIQSLERQNEARSSQQSGQEIKISLSLWDKRVAAEQHFQQSIQSTQHYVSVCVCMGNYSALVNVNV